MLPCADFPPPPPALLPPNEGPTPTDDQEPHRPWLVLVLYSLMGAMGDVITSAVIFVLLQSWGSVLAVLSAVGWTVCGQIRTSPCGYGCVFCFTRATFAAVRLGRS